MTDILTHRIIVIDDHYETLSIIQRVLQQHGYDVEATTNPIEGIALAKKILPDLVMVDGMMPEMSGWEVCRELRSIPTLSQLRIIMFSAVSEAEQKLAGFNAGADDYMTKPTEPTEMIERVKILLENIAPRPSETKSEPSNSKTHTLAYEDLGYSSSLSSVMDLPSSTHLIAVMGARGGSGTTTTAINVAAALALARHNTTLIDLDMQQGHVAIYLKQPEAQGLNTLIQQGGEAAAQHLTPLSESFNLLLSQPQQWDDENASLSVDVLTRIVQALAQTSQYIVVDCSNHLTPHLKPLVEQANDIVLCFRPERLSLAVVKERIKHLQNVMSSQSKLRPIVLDFNGHANVPKDGIEKFLGMNLTAVIPLTPKEMNLAVSKNKPIVQLNPQAKPSILFRQLAQQMVKV